ncbi:MAG: hypothetical protein IIB12_08300 [Chloroflexi bacterium]|nr:hypothetical protein [Chloroflexota bacterium]
MCGIIGCCGSTPVLPTILEGLKRLEYRGYDSAGVAVFDPPNGVVIRKNAGKLADLVAAIDEPLAGTVGMGHTRWATHGRPSVDNAHPHTDCTGSVAVVHNGIVENYRELKQRLEGAGHRFRSQTDTEVVAHLVEDFLAGGADVEEAAIKAGNELTGAQVIVVLNKDEPDRLVGMRIGHAGGLAVGYGADAMYLASDLPAIVGKVDQVVYLEDREVATITRTGVKYGKLDGTSLEKTPLTVTQDPAAAAKGPYRHFMLKEIMEQPETLVSALRDRVDFQAMQVFILVRTTFVPGGGNNLFLLTLSNPSRTSQIVRLHSSWERHPDGIGYTHSWRPSCGGWVIMVGNYRTFGQAVSQFNSEYQTPVAALRQKRKLSEIDDATLELRSLEILTRVHQNAANWALRQ